MNLSAYLVLWLFRMIRQTLQEERKWKTSFFNLPIIILAMKTQFCKKELSDTEKLDRDNWTTLEDCYLKISKSLFLLQILPTTFTCIAKK